MISDLKGRIALVTGSGRGIGRSISMALAAAGAHAVMFLLSLSERAAIDQIYIRRSSSSPF